MGIGFMGRVVGLWVKKNGETVCSLRLRHVYKMRGPLLKGACVYLQLDDKSLGGRNTYHLSKFRGCKSVLFLKKQSISFNFSYSLFSKEFQHTKGMYREVAPNWIN